MVAIALFLYGPVGLLLVGVSAYAAVLAWREHPSFGSVLRFSRRLLLGFWAGSLVLAALHWLSGPDWVELWWSAQIPLVIAFLGSGALLATACRDDGLVRGSAWWFLAITASLAVTPILLQLLDPMDPSLGRDVGEPVRRLVELARWGFGGPLPECLVPITAAEGARGVGHLPREVTVPMGTLLVGSWSWLAFCAMAITGHVFRRARVRRAWLCVAPIVVSIVIGVSGDVTTLGCFDPRFFGPDSSRQSGIWRSDPLVMRSFGPVLLAALLAACVLAVLRSRAATRRVAGPRPAGVQG